MTEPKVSVIIPVYNVEEYINNMLSSVKAQTFKNFEVILVNDGSTDGSQNIIDKFCRDDSRFRAIKKENGGVASARNMGIEAAKGQYIVFYDPDDYIPCNALEKMYKTAVKNKADMVVGVMEEKSLDESLIYMHSQKLAKQKNIDNLDEHFFGAWSLCHKMFSTDLIRKNNLRIEKLKNAEDGVFTFCALNCAEKICGCDVVAYNYIKRPFWLFPSATQTISRDYLEGLLASHDRILQEANKLAEKSLDQDGRKTYLEKLYVRFIEGEMINGYYRGTWRAEDDLTERITERTEQYRRHITEKQWNQIVKRGRDLSLEEGYLTAEELDKHPVISVAVTGDLSEKELNLAVGSLYNQSFLRFELMITASDFEKLEPAYRKKKNLHITEGNKKEMVQKARGRYILFVNEPVIYTKNSIKQMEAVLHKNEKADFVSLLLKHFDGNKYNDIPVISAAYGYTKKSKYRNNTLTESDIFFSNKLIRKSILEHFTFTGRDILDVRALYRNYSFEKIRKGVMITTYSQEKILKMCGNHPSESVIHYNYLLNNGINKAINKAKRYITREDIENLRKKMGK